MTDLQEQALQVAEATPTDQQAKDRGKQRRERWGLLGAAVVILALSVALHLVHLAQTPGWDSDEGYNLDIAWNLLHGRLRMFALTSAFVQHPPLFYLILALAIRLFGYSMLTLRLLAVFYSLLTTLALLTLGRRMFGPGPALWGALAFTIAPLALDNTRWGYTYSQLMLVAFLGVYACWRYLETREYRWLLVASVLGALAVLSDYEGAFLPLLVILVAWRVRPRHIWTAAGIGLGIPTLGLLALLAATPATFLSDLAATAARAGGGNPIVQALNVIINFQHLLSLDPWVILGLIGLWFIRDARLRGLVFVALTLMLIALLKVRDLNPYFHSGVPLLPWFGLGAGLAIDRGITTLYTWLNSWWDTLFGKLTAGARWLPKLKRFSVALILFLALISPLGITMAADAVGIANGLHTRIDTSLAVHPTDAERAASYILTHAQAGDVVLCSPQVAWLLDDPEDSSGHETGILATEPLQSVAYSGQGIAFYPADLTPDRFAFAPSAANARFAIVDDFWRALAAPDQAPQVKPLLTLVESWPKVYQVGEYTIYERGAP
ncbi:MAG TPA: glycosyltransferase family 39 protein [Ktedonobacterales bacterium]|nr:glycosyltransferase family 39 protein [Ktedonobacterales bacterium]